jgi:hypothetical protein
VKDDMTGWQEQMWKYSTRGLDPKTLQQTAPSAQLHVMQLTGYHEMLSHQLGLPEVL